jgi:pyruvate,water dikinase
MADGLLAFASGFAPRPVTYRTIDFRTNEFRGLAGGGRFEPVENCCSAQIATRSCWRASSTSVTTQSSRTCSS